MQRLFKAPYSAPAVLPILGCMDQLWTPWRYSYVTGQKPKGARPGVPPALEAWPGDFGCVFCNIIGAVDWAVEHGMPAGEAEHAVFLLERGPLCFTVLNGYPYNNGHLMVVPYRHEASLAALSPATASELMSSARRAETALREVYRPHGLNMGLNLPVPVWPNTSTFTLCPVGTATPTS